MTDLILFDDAAVPAADPADREVVAALNGRTFVLVSAPTPPACWPREWPDMLPDVTAPPPSRLRRFFGNRQRWYDVGVALLVLAAGGVALWRLLWMGQP